MQSLEQAAEPPSFPPPWEQSPLDRAERAIQENDYQALAEVAEDIAVLIDDNRHLAEPLLIVADCLAADNAYLPQAVEAAKVAARYAPRQAVSIILKHLDELPELKQRIAAAKVAVNYATYGTAHGWQAWSAAVKHMDAIPAVVTLYQARERQARARQAAEQAERLKIPTVKAVKAFSKKFRVNVA